MFLAGHSNPFISCESRSSIGRLDFHPRTFLCVPRRNKMQTQQQIVVALLMLIGVISAFPAEQKAVTQRPPVSEDALEMALSDKRYLMRQLKCALGQGTCDPVGRRLKSLAPLVLRGSCPQCTPSEMRQIQKVLAHVQRNFPNEWNMILNQYAG